MSGLGRPLSYYATLSPGEAVDIDALLSHHRARFGASTMENPAADDSDTVDDDKDKDKDDDKSLGDAGKKALAAERAKAAAERRRANAAEARAAALEAASQTEAERAVAAAKAEAKTEAMKDVAPRLVQAEFRAASAKVIDADRLADLLEDIDLTRFLDEDGEVDAARVAKKVAAWAPAEQAPKKPGSPKPDPHQGAGDGTAGKTGGQAGKAEAERRFGKKQ